LKGIVDVTLNTPGEEVLEIASKLTSNEYSPDFGVVISMVHIMRLILFVTLFSGEKN
jgi:hypothetical protein